MRFRVLSAAQIEATESALWYKDQQSGLADDFFTEMQKAFERIRDKPQGLSRLEHYSGPHGIRRCLMSRFPYAVIFLVGRDEAVVVAVAHTRRRVNSGHGGPPTFAASLMKAAEAQPWKRSSMIWSNSVTESSPVSLMRRAVHRTGWLLVSDWRRL